MRPPMANRSHRWLPPRPVLALALGLGIALAPALIAFGSGWMTLFQASFVGVPDGPGDGITFPAEVGTIETFTASGDPFPVVAPASGVLAEALLLSDEGGATNVDFGVHCKVMRATLGAVRLSFEFCSEVEGTSLSVDVTDTTGVDIARIRFDGDGSISVGDKPDSTTGWQSDQVDYGVDIRLLPDHQGADRYVILVVNLESGEVVGLWNGKIPGGYRPVSTLTLTKLGASPGAVSFDSIVVDELVK